jgi:hypothetical protein
MSLQDGRDAEHPGQPVALPGRADLVVGHGAGG